ncbi:MAG: hypothetical protein MUC49_08600 [Raineya sp.]|jgi:hypothetical protein|nr:hypothetical protein [Raineya sp.]
MKSSKIDLQKKDSSNRKGLKIILLSILCCTLVIPFSFWLRELSAKRYISNLLLKDSQIYIVQTSLYPSEDGDYTESKLILLDNDFKQSQSTELITDIKKVFVLDNGFAFLSFDTWNRFQGLVKVNTPTLKTEIIDKDFLTKNHFPQGIEAIEYSEISGLLKVTDKKGYVSYIDLDTFRNYGQITDQYAFRDKNQKPEQIHEVISDQNVMYNHYEQFGMDYSQRRRKIYKTPTNQKIEIGTKNAQQLQEEQAQKEARASSIDFLDGKFLGASLKHKKLIILSFEDTEHTKFYIHGLNTDLQQLWQKSSFDLNIPIKNLVHTSFAIDDNRIYLSFHNELIALDSQTGTLIKRVKI